MRKMPTKVTVQKGGGGYWVKLGRNYSMWFPKKMDAVAAQRRVKKNKGYR